MRLRVQLLMILFCGIALTNGDDLTKVNGEELGQNVPKINSKIEFEYSDGYDWDSSGRMAPPDLGPHVDEGYVITPQRLKEIRSQFLYWFFDQDSNGGRGDYQSDIQASVTQLHKNLTFQLPFFGFRFNYIRVSMNGYLEFSDGPMYFLQVYPLISTYRNYRPLILPWPFNSFGGYIYSTDIDQRIPGVYFRIESDLMTRTDRFGVEVRERVMWDIREGVVGAETFIPKHAVIVTWKNMSLAGSRTGSLFRTNTFQTVLATDEVSTYAIFNYATVQVERPYLGFIDTKAVRIDTRDLTSSRCGNGFPGRHLFRIDDQILIGSCVAKP